MLYITQTQQQTTKRINRLKEEKRKELKPDTNQAERKQDKRHNKEIRQENKQRQKKDKRQN